MLERSIRHAWKAWHVLGVRSAFQVRERRLDSGFDKVIELPRFGHDFVGLRVGSHVRPRLVDDVALPPAGLEIIGIRANRGTDGEGDRLDRDLVVSGLGSDAVSGARDGHVRSLKRGVVRGGEPAIR
jgi:hypothetical protein